MKSRSNAARSWMRSGRSFLLLALLGIAPVAATPRGTAAQEGTARGTAAQGPVEAIQARNRAVEDILEDIDGEPTVEQREELKDLINALIDFRELSRLALGRYWDERTEDEREDFVEVFRELVRNSSVRKLEIYRADSVTYESPEVESDRAEVVTRAHKGRKQVEIVYRMHRVDGEWQVFDMVVDGASTARTYRDSFYKEIARSSYEDMYAKLVDRLEDERGQP